MWRLIRRRRWLWVVAVAMAVWIRPTCAASVGFRYEGPGVEVIPSTGNSFPITGTFSLEDSLFGVAQPAQDLAFHVDGFGPSSIFFPARNEVMTDLAGNVVGLDILLGGVDESLTLAESDWFYEVQGVLDPAPQRRIEATAPPTVTIVPEPSWTGFYGLGLAAFVFLLGRRSPKPRHGERDCLAVGYR